MRLVLSAGIASFLTVSSFAASQILCPGKLSFVTMGDSVSTVLATCGKPVKTIKKTLAAKGSTDSSAKDMRWYYTNMFEGRHATNAGIITFNGSGDVASIQGGNGKTLKCQHGTIKIGDSMSTVSQTCGLPQAQATDKQLQNTMSGNGLGGREKAFNRISTLNTRNPFYGNKTTTSSAATAASASTSTLKGKHTTTILIYQPASYEPKTAMVFFDNKLAQSGRVTSESNQ